jgi:cob(I)alamin adenosyltransferase
MLAVQLPNHKNRHPMKIYTRTGDDGTTGLIGGQRVPKSDPRIDCVGTIDEVNAALGCCAAAGGVGGQAHEIFIAQFRAVQNDLFVLGSHLALAEGSGADRNLPPLEDSIVSRLEMEIDAADARLPQLRNFILPGGTELAARLHLARTICRRAERRLVDFAHDRPVPAILITYLNRLSDWLFVQARLANAVTNIPDIPWNPRQP